MVSCYSNSILSQTQPSRRLTPSGWFQQLQLATPISDRITHRNVQRLESCERSVPCYRRTDRLNRTIAIVQRASVSYEIDRFRRNKDKEATLKVMRETIIFDNLCFGFVK